MITKQPYVSNNLRSVGVTEINIECGFEYARDGSEISQSFIIDFKQFIPHRDNPVPNPVSGNSLTVSNLHHRIIEIGTIEDGLEKVMCVAKAFFAVGGQ